jgi:ParB family chromosome partitioning protein
MGCGVKIVKIGERAVTTRSRAKAAEVHGAELAGKIAERVKDSAALETALLTKLEAQRDFAAEYQSIFPHGFGPGRGNKRDATSGVSLGMEWCLAHGFALRSVQRWCELCDPANFVEKTNAVVKKCLQLAELWQAANFMSESIEWYTPAQYLKAVRDVLGEIDLDPASSAQANIAVGAKEYFDEKADGLRRSWRGNFFMNPPYGKTSDGKSLAAEFCNKALDEHARGNVSAGIILVNSLHSQAWQAPLYDHAICFVNHRIQFVSADGEENKNPTFQNIFIYLGTDLAKFSRAFSGFGYVMVRM